ncbi:hypothetical protein BpHYR1_041865 [Brachionus plicatilis]|uniref:Uncharacterized protein n=1 Tax=Brachionus plicatilis TaxID=10195 RepID=A0A3M7PBQ7_BRAPC|nr:hypothetical protein BpHYR1_041865 [Brachionus plicatilis]
MNEKLKSRYPKKFMYDDDMMHWSRIKYTSNRVFEGRRVVLAKCYPKYKPLIQLGAKNFAYKFV